jgi:hypothetical protein
MFSSGIQSLFKALSTALKNNNEESFKHLWHTESYTRNLVGPDGMSGDAVFTQAVNGSFTLIPELNDVEELEDPDAYIIGCYLKPNEVSSTDNVDYRYILIGKDKTQQLFLWAMGETKEALLGLWSRLSQNAAATHSVENVINPENIAPIISMEEAALELIKELNIAIFNNNEQLFSQYWLPRAYHFNLSADGGLSGREFYTQAVSQQWQLKGLLEYASLYDHPEAILIPCQLWLKMLEIPKNNDERMLLLVNSNGSLKALGMGTDLSEMRHLYLSFKGEALKG